MDLKVVIDVEEWAPSNKYRLTANIFEETQFQEAISKVTVLTKPDDDVTCNDAQTVWAYGCKLLVTIPTNLKDFFPNTIALCLANCGLKAISRKDLKGLEQLTEIALIGMKIRELPADLFADLMNLEVIEFNDNRIQFSGKDIFEHLERVKYIDLRDNPGIDVIYATEKYDDIDPETRVYTLKDLNLRIDKAFHETSEWIQDLKKLLRCNAFKDFSIKIGQKEFKVHKFILAALSSTLAEMIKRTPDADELILEDIDEEIFELILDFIYHDKLPLSQNKIEQLYGAASKLKLEKLANFAASELAYEVNRSNAIKYLQLASVHNSDELKEKCIEEIKEIFADSIHSLDDDVFDNFEVLKAIVQEKLKADEKIQKALEEFKKMKG